MNSFAAILCIVEHELETVELAEREIDFAKLDALIREKIPYLSLIHI